MSKYDEETALSNEGSKVAVSDELQNNGKEETKKCKPWYYVVLGVILVAAIVVAITTPLVNKDEPSKGSTQLDPTCDPTTNINCPGNGGPGEGSTGPNITVTPYSAFHPNLPNFDVKILEGYKTEDEFAQDCGDALRALLDRVVARNLGKRGYENVGRGGMMVDVAFAEDDGDTAARPAAPSTDAAPQEAPPRDKVGNDVNDFGTNNQEDDVEEGDIVVANQNHMFIAYGDRVVRTKESEVLLTNC